MIVNDLVNCYSTSVVLGSKRFVILLLVSKSISVVSIM